MTYQSRRMLKAKCAMLEGQLKSATNEVRDLGGDVETLEADQQALVNIWWDQAVRARMSMYMQLGVIGVSIFAAAILGTYLSWHFHRSYLLVLGCAFVGAFAACGVFMLIKNFQDIPEELVLPSGATVVVSPEQIHSTNQGLADALR